MTAAESPRPVSWRLRWRLSVLWLLEWGITGALLTYLPLYFVENGLTESQLGWIMAVSAIGLWVAPLVVGQICDRWLASDKYLAISHFVGGLTLMSIPLATDMYRAEAAGSFGVLMLLMGLYACAYVPTMPLASSLTFRHLADPDRQFGGIRIWGTVGWVLSGLFLSFWLGREQGLARFDHWALDWDGGLADGFWSRQVDRLAHSLSGWGAPDSADCFRIAAVLSFALSTFCVFLPATPPSRSDKGRIAPLQVVGMFRDPVFAGLISVSLLLALFVPFYSYAVPLLLERLGYESHWIPAVMTVGQISEFPALLLLPVCLKRLGLIWTYALGMVAWLVRYALFAGLGADWLILSGVGLHGVCHVFLIIVVQLYVDTSCRSDLRASAQNVFAFLTLGVAMPLGFVLAGWLGEACRLNDPELADYRRFFAVPAVAIAILLAGYVAVALRFRNSVPPASQVER